MYSSWRTKCCGDNSIPCCQLTELSLISSILFLLGIPRVPSQFLLRTQVAVDAKNRILLLDAQSRTAIGICNHPMDRILRIARRHQAQDLVEQVLSRRFLKSVVRVQADRSQHKMGTAYVLHAISHNAVDAEPVETRSQQTQVVLRQNPVRRIPLDALERQMQQKIQRQAHASLRPGEGL